MSKTPEEAMAALDAAVKEFTSVNLEQKGIVTGWVLMLSTSEFLTDGALINDCFYSVGPDTDMIRAVGLAKVGSARMNADIV